MNLKLLGQSFLAFFISPFALIGSVANSSADPYQVLPLTEEAVERFMRQAEDHVVKTVGRLTSIPSDQKSAEKIMRPWNRLSNEILETFTVLSFLTKSTFPSKTAAGTAMQSFQTFLSKSLVQNTHLYRSLMDYVEQSLRKNPLLSPYERYEIDCLLNSCEQIKSSLTPKEQETLKELKTLNSQNPKTPFMSFKSPTPEKSCKQKYPLEGLSILTLNSCFVPTNFPFLFGGVYSPWQQRVSLLAKKILSLDADVVCLQEIHAEDASLALYDQLKSKYTYFYGAIGPRVLGFSLNTLGLPSGLFVASKYPIEKPRFTLFTKSGFPMNYGFFDFVLKNGDTPIGHLYTTHLQSLDYPQFDQIRASQLQQILDQMHSDLDAEKQKTPFFLCGDLNIPYGSKEPGEALIRAHFYDDYNKNQQQIDETSSTCTDYFTNYLFSSSKNPDEIDPNFQIIDYALLLRSVPSPNQHSSNEGYRMTTAKIPMHDLKKPDSAISDHHALLSSIKLK